MARYKCSVCEYIYDEEKEGVPFDKLPPDWICPICESAKSYFRSRKDLELEEKYYGGESSPASSKTEEYKRDSDDLEIYMSDIREIARTGKSIIEPMRTRKPVVSWDDILIKGAQLAKIPLDRLDEVATRTVIGPKAKKPLTIETPIYVSHMSYGALSKEIKIALAKGSAIAKTAICSGEGGILTEEIENAHKYIFEYVPNKYSVTEENLKRADAIEIKFGQSTKPGMGGHLPGEKVTAEIAKVRGFEEGKDIISPSFFPDITDQQGLKKKIDWLREVSNGRPIGVKIAAGKIKEDILFAVQAEPDFITLDGRPGGTGASSKFVKASTSIPTIFALYKARKALDESGVKGITLVITGGLRISSDFAKALAMGADAVAIATSALMAVGCQQYRVCHTGKCPVGITTQDPELRARVNIENSAGWLANFIRVSTAELKDFARLTGNKSVHDLSVSDLITINSEISNHTSIEHA
jgi:methylamine---glutamate N-methyltransferase subunit C